MEPVTHARSNVVLFTGLVLVSTSGPFIKASGVDAFAMAFLRLALSAGVFGAWAALSGQWRIDRRHLRAIVIAALLLASHFALWMKAFDLTDYSSNLLLLVAQPIVAALIGSRFGEHPTRSTWISVVLAIGGLAAIAGNDYRLGMRALVGDAMSILAGVTITLSYVLARKARAETPLPAFMAVVMAIGAAAMLPLAIVSGAKMTGYSGESWTFVVALVLLTTVAGHGLMNLASRHVTLFALNVVIVLEPALGILMGWPLFGAQVTTIQLVGGAVLAVAVVVGLRKPFDASARTH